ncbi:MAG: hypothetical protein ACC742_01270 [Thermoanaerobaculales bacterium]
MSEVGKTTGADLIRGIVKGQVPRQVRLFAAQGLLPVSLEELFGLQVLLSADPDEELAQLATNSINEVDVGTLLNWIADDEPDPMVLDLLIRVRKEETIWAAVASHSGVSDETLRVLARNASPLVQDIIITNQVRLMECLEILDDLRANKKASQVVLRRVREFEAEFIEKAIESAAVPGGDGTPSIEEALESLRFIGAHIPEEERMPYPSSEDPALADAVGRTDGSAFGRLLKMNIKEKVICGLKGTREERAILIHSRNRLVYRAVLASPKISEVEIERIAGSKSVAEDAIRVIAANPRWIRLYPVVLALALNPKTPIQASLRLLARLSHRDIARVARDRNVNPVVRRKANEVHSRRR